MDGVCEAYWSVGCERISRRRPTGAGQIWHHRRDIIINEELIDVLARLNYELRGDEGEKVSEGCDLCWKFEIGR